jgi:hypothetical protein
MQSPLNCSRHWIASRFRTAALIAALLLGLLSSAQPAAAQGTMGLLPGPITTSELDGYSDRLALSPQQRRAVENLHDQYKKEFRSLREGEIAAFIKQMEEMEGSASGMPTRKQVESFLKRMQDLNRRIAAIDNALFDQFPTLLTEEQVSMLQRVKQARQRARLSGQRMLWMIGQAPPDLSQIVFDLELSAGDRAAAEPVLAPYESRLTADFTRLSDESTRAISEMFEGMEKMGITDETMQDPEQAEKVGEAMQTLMQDMAARSMEIASQVIDLNQRTFRSLVGALPEEPARKLKQAYYTRAFPETAFAVSTGDGVFEKALSLPDLTEDQRAGILATRETLRKSLDAVCEEMVADVIEWRKRSTPFSYDEQAAQDYNKKQQEYYARADKARSDGNESLKTLLGDHAQQIGDLRTAQDDAADAAGMIVAQTLEGGVVAEAANPAEVDPYGDDFAWGNDQFLPPPISERDLTEYADRLSLNEDQRTLLKDLHQRYTEAWQKNINDKTTALQTAASSLWRWDDTAQQSFAPKEDQINDIYKMRVSVLEDVIAADAAFFDELGLTLIDPANPQHTAALQRVRLSRQRSTYNRGSWSYTPASESGIDLSRLLLREKRKIAADSFAAVDAEVFKWEQAAVPLMRERYLRSMEAQKVQEIWSAEMTRASQEGSNAMALSMKYQEMMRAPQKALSDANVALADHTRASIAAILAALPAADANRVRRNYNLRAFPNVFSDGGALEQTFERALALHDLTDDQRRRLSDLAAEYHPAYAGFCEQMVEASKGMERDNWMAMSDPETATDWRKRQETMARLTFDRSELNARSAGRIKDILTLDQLKSIGGLPKVEEDQDDMW